ncbi:MAG TPA: CoA transferase [Pseudogracilibacillus sp.]|nr:CoA transferase [Pseudogracilibacillus sp.]
MPLKSIRVLDLTRLLPGPYCTMLLADFGAEVTKVEQPGLGDYARFIGPKSSGGSSAFFNSLNRNKQSVTLDLKTKSGKEALLKLVDETDVLIESFRPGVMEKLGLDYATLKKRRPELIYCAITGYGQTGPYKDLPGHDLNYLSYAGLLDLMGPRDGDPVVPGTTIADIAGGALPATVGILMSLIHRQKTGEGQYVDISMMDGVISLLQTVLPDYLTSGNLPKRGSQLLDGGYANYNIYQTKDERYLAVGAVEEKFWVNFCTTINRTDLIPLLNAPLHKQHQLKADIQKVIMTKSLAEWVDAFSNIEACVSPVNTLEEMVNDPQVIAREMIETIFDEQLGELQQIGIPIKLSKTPGEIRSLAPQLNKNPTIK